MHKKIGLIGGVGPQSTNFIYQKIIEFAQVKYNAKNNGDYPNILIESVPIPDFISNTDNLGIAKEMLINSVKSLTSAGATRLCIGSNTVHVLLDDLRKETQIPFISMIDLVAKKCVANGFRKVGILGTPTLITSGIYNKELEVNYIEEILPSSEQIRIVEQIIREVIGGVKEITLKKEYIELLNDLYNKGAESIILGCTELPLAVNYEALGNKTLNSDEIFAEGLVDYFYE